MTGTPQSALLDIGCGDGRDTEYLLQNQASVVSLDYSHSMLREARKRKIRPTLCQMDMRSIGFAESSFDGIWANECIYHVPKAEFQAVLKEIIRVLKPRGVFPFNLKIGEGEGLDETPRSYKRGPRYYAYYSRGEINDNLKRVGFESAEIKKYPEKILGEEIIHLWCRKPSAA